MSAKDGLTATLLSTNVSALPTHAGIAMHAQGMSGQSFRAHKPNKRRRDCWHADAACNMQHHTSLVSVGTVPPDNSDDTLNCVVSLWWSSDRHNDY